MPISLISAAAGGASSWLLPLALVGMLGFMFFQQSREKKKEKEMISNLEVGDEIITAGGIVGRFISSKEDTILIETGPDRIKLRFLRSAIHTNITATERAAEKKSSKKTEKTEKAAKSEIEEEK